MVLAKCIFSICNKVLLWIVYNIRTDDLTFFERLSQEEVFMEIKPLADYREPEYPQLQTVEKKGSFRGPLREKGGYFSNGRRCSNIAYNVRDADANNERKSAHTNAELCRKFHTGYNGFGVCRNHNSPD